MPMKSTSSQARQKQLKQLYRAICELLFREWDPIGASLISSGVDEYDCLAPRIYRLIKEKASDEEIADYLATAQQSHLGLDSVSKEQYLKVARQLLDLVNKV